MNKRRGKTLAYKPGAGEDRDYWAIKKWLHDRRITLDDIAKMEPPVAVTIVSGTIRGVRNSRLVIQRLLALGCPAKIINLPDDMSGSERE